MQDAVPFPKTLLESAAQRTLPGGRQQSLTEPGDYALAVQSAGLFRLTGLTASEHPNGPIGRFSGGRLVPLEVGLRSPGCTAKQSTVTEKLRILLQSRLRFTPLQAAEYGL